jgi:long-chain acyl-CoA synthetase
MLTGMPTTAEHNLARLAESAHDRLGDHESLVFEKEVYRSGDLFESGVRAGTALQELGIGPGDRVVVLMTNCPEVAVTYNAIWRAGAVVTPVMFLVSPDELEHILVDSAARAVVTSPSLLETVSSAAARAPELRHVLVVGEADGTDTVSLPERVRRTAFTEAVSAPRGSIVNRDDDDVAALMYTGGTTGRSKGVVLTHRNLDACARSSHEAAYVPGITRTLTPLPLAHAYGLIVTLVGLHAEEPGLAVLQPWFDPVEWLALAQEHEVQRASLVPSMIQMLLAHPLEEADLSALRFIGSGAAPLADEVRQEWQRRVPSSQILDGYGCTESGAVISVTRPGQTRPGSVGTAIPGYSVEIHADDDTAVPVGAHGEICVRAEGVMSGYWNAPEETAHTLRGGWLHTGDVGYLDDDGFLYVVDRKKDLIIRGGFNVYPRDVEEVLLGHPAVASVGVVGRPDVRLGEEVVAFVALLDGAEAAPEELVAFARERLAGHKYPREVLLLDAMPLTNVGKLDRKALRTRF